jgi:cytochrome c oxidase subunit IV
MMRLARPIAAVWLALGLLFALELAGALTGWGHALGSALLIPAAAMVWLVGFYFMRVRVAGRLARFFALAAVFWLLVLLGLGSIDPMTRTVYPVAVTQYP